jgi:hypothetical protein
MHCLNLLYSPTCLAPNQLYYNPEGIDGKDVVHPSRKPPVEQSGDNPNHPPQPPPVQEQSTAEASGGAVLFAAISANPNNNQGVQVLPEDIPTQIEAPQYPPTNLSPAPSEESEENSIAFSHGSGAGSSFDEDPSLDDSETAISVRHQLMPNDFSDEEEEVFLESVEENTHHYSNEQGALLPSGIVFGDRSSSYDDSDDGDSEDDDGLNHGLRKEDVSLSEEELPINESADDTPGADPLDEASETDPKIPKCDDSEQCSLWNILQKKVQKGNLNYELSRIEVALTELAGMLSLKSIPLYLFDDIVTWAERFRKIPRTSLQNASPKPNPNRNQLLKTLAERSGMEEMLNPTRTSVFFPNAGVHVNVTTADVEVVIVSLLTSKQLMQEKNVSFF